MIDGHDYGATETDALGGGVSGTDLPSDPAKIIGYAASFSGGYSVSNAKRLRELSRWSICVNVAGGAGPTIAGSVCFSTKSKPPAEVYKANDLSGTWIAYVGVGGGGGFQASLSREFTRVAIIHKRFKLPIVDDPVCEGIKLATRIPFCPKRV